MTSIGFDQNKPRQTVLIIKQPRISPMMAQIIVARIDPLDTDALYSIARHAHGEYELDRNELRITLTHTGVAHLPHKTLQTLTQAVRDTLAGVPITAQRR